MGSDAEPRALDLQIQQKILPKFAATAAKLERPLMGAARLPADWQSRGRSVHRLALDALAPPAAKYPESVAALKHMLQTLRQVGFASFIE